MNIVAFIPARMGSSRFPGKPLAMLGGLTMTEHVYRRCCLAECLSDVIVATCDREIETAVKDFGGQVIMTKDTHERASDRVAEAMLTYERTRGKRIDIVVMVQGDEPMVVPAMIDEAVAPLRQDQSMVVSNITAPIKTQEEVADINTVKVVVDHNGFALYFSRSPIPYPRDKKTTATYLKQVCIIPFQRDFLIAFNQLPQTPLEIAESVDMLRVLEHGYKVKMVPTRFETQSVDTPEDLRKVERLMQGDPLVKKYLCSS